VVRGSWFVVRGSWFVHKSAPGATLGVTARDRTMNHERLQAAP
jgi:hypothetical protein